MGELCPVCGMNIYATYLKGGNAPSGIAPMAAQYRGYDIGEQWAICLFGHHWKLKVADEA